MALKIGQAVQILPEYEEWYRARDTFNVMLFDITQPCIVTRKPFYDPFGNLCIAVKQRSYTVDAIGVRFVRVMAQPDPNRIDR